MPDIELLLDLPNVLGYVLEKFFLFVVNFYSGYAIILMILTIAAIVIIYFRFISTKVMGGGFLTK